MSTELRFRHGDDSWRWLEGVGNNLLDDPQVQGIVANYRDITERKRAGEALRESEARYSTLVEQAMDGVVVAQDGEFRFVNRGMAEITGYSTEEMVGMPFLDMIEPEYRDMVVQRQKSRGTGEEVEPVVEVRIRCKDGSVKDIEPSTATIQYQGRPALVIVVRDVTERKRAEEALQASEGRYRLLAENASDVIYLMDTELRPTYVSPSIMRLVGYSAEEVMCRGVDELLTPASLEVALQALAEDQAIESAGQKEQYRSQPLEMELRCKDGSTVWEETRLTFLRDPDGQITGYLGVMRDITERKRLEEALQKQMHDLGERVKELNCLYAISRLAGKQDASLEEILEGVVGLIPPAWQYPEITCARTILGDQEFRTENFSETIWKQSSNIVVEGNPIGTLEVYYLQEKPGADEGPFSKEERRLIEAIGEQLGRITERKRAEEALRESEEKYRRLVGTLHEGVWVIDKDAYTTFVNPPMAEMLGYTPDEMGGKHLFSFMDERGVEIAKRNLERRQRGIEEQHDFEFIRKDGTRIYTILATGPIADDHGNYVGAVAGVLDITERKRAEEEILQRNRELAALHHILLSITQTLDLQEVMEEIVSQAGTALGSGYTSIVTVNEDGSLGMRSKSFTGISPFPIEPRPNGATRTVINTGQPVVVEDVDADEDINPALLAAGIKSFAGVPIRSKDSTIGALFVHSSQPNAFANRLSLLADLANQAAIAIENTRLYKEASTVGALREADRLKTELLSNVSHELRTPLTSIKGYCTSMLHYYDRLTDDDKRDSLHEINQASDKLAQLVENLLQLSRLETAGLHVEKEPTRVESVISAAVEDIEGEAKEYHFVTHAQESLPMVEADPGRIRQVMDNLLSNAVKFSPEGTEISVSCEAKGQELVVSVRDCGKGISREDLDKVFDRFYQVSPGLVQQGSGAGLGLAICKHIVEAHGGRTWAESEPGQGSTFVFTLPLMAHKSEGQ